MSVGDDPNQGEGETKISSQLPASVLVVDDSASDRRLISEILKDLRPDVVVTTAATLGAARQALAEASFEIILLDLGLSDAKELEGLLILADVVPTTPIVVVTAHPDESFVYAALNRGADEYLNKSDLDARRVRDALLRAIYRRTGRRRYDRLGNVTHRSLNSLDAPAATLDVTGRISAVNDAWEVVARNGGTTLRTTGVGVNYLTVSRQAAGEFAVGADEVANGIESVLNGEQEKFSYDYPCVIDGEERWFTVRVAPLHHRGGGAVVTHVDVTDVTRAESDVRRLALELESNNELPLSLFHDHAAEIYALVDARGVILHRSASTYRLLGNEPINGLSVQVLTRVDFADEQLALDTFTRVSATPHASEQLIVRVIDRHGRHRTLDLTLTNLLDDPAVAAIVISGNDITEGRFVQIADKIQSRLLKILPAAVVVTDYNGTVVLWNDHAAKLFGYSSGDVLGRTSPELRLRPEALRTIDAAVMMSGHWEGDYTAIRTDGTSVPVHTIVELIDAPDINFQGIVSASIDVTDRRELEEALEFQLRYDVLTRLPNRLLLVEHLERELETRRATSVPMAILMVDFDDFRRVNDQFGHGFGDEVLKTWVAHVAAMLSPADLLARVTGNKFVVCRSSATTVEAALEVALQLSDFTARPVAVGNQSVSFTASIGIAMSGPDSRAERLIRNADHALYAAKEKGSSRIELFDDSYHDDVRARNQLRAELADAVANEEIEAYFQPEVDLTTGSILGFEALARWHHRVRGDISPEEFIPLSEQSGLIGKIGQSMLEASCRALHQWNELSPLRRLTVAVNVSPLQLVDSHFPDSVREVCERFEVNPEDICLEVTESALADESMAFHALNELKGVGVRIAIDDFGTGYSSLRRLNRYPLDFLKIDQSFVAELSSLRHHSVIVASVIGIAGALQLGTVGEGIETDTQRQRLAEAGCGIGQGFLFSAGVPLDEATAFIANGTQFNPYEVQTS